MQGRTWAIVAWALYISSFFTAGITANIGLIIAYVKRDDLNSTPFGSHLTSAIRTDWISLIGIVIGSVLLLVFVGYFILFLLGLWGLFRCVRGLIKAADNEPISNPTGWL